jgi:hypothetical protein
MYLWAREWGIQPSEFWGMTIPEWWLEYDMKAPKAAGDTYAGNLTRADVEELKELLEDGPG